jgi:hypothetical protein
MSSYSRRENVYYCYYLLQLLLCGVLQWRVTTLQYDEDYTVVATRSKDSQPTYIDRAYPSVGTLLVPNVIFTVVLMQYLVV